MKLVYIFKLKKKKKKGLVYKSLVVLYNGIYFYFLKLMVSKNDPTPYSSIEVVHRRDKRRLATRPSSIEGIRD